MDRYTYEIIFTRLDDQPEGVQQYTDEGFARKCNNTIHKIVKIFGTVE